MITPYFCISTFVQLFYNFSKRIQNVFKTNHACIRLINDLTIQIWFIFKDIFYYYYIIKIKGGKLGLEQYKN